MPKTIQIDLNPDGTLTIDALGFQGKACDAALAEIVEALGCEVTRRNLKPEYHTRQEEQRKAETHG